VLQSLVDLRRFRFRLLIRQTRPDRGVDPRMKADWPDQTRMAGALLIHTTGATLTWRLERSFLQLLHIANFFSTMVQTRSGARSTATKAPATTHTTTSVATATRKTRRQLMSFKQPATPTEPEPEPESDEELGFFFKSGHGMPRFCHSPPPLNTLKTFP
jgi:hypothetical protein